MLARNVLWSCICVFVCLPQAGMVPYDHENNVTQNRSDSLSVAKDLHSSVHAS